MNDRRVVLRYETGWRCCASALTIGYLSAVVVLKTLDATQHQKASALPTGRLPRTEHHVWKARCRLACLRHLTAAGHDPRAIHLRCRTTIIIDIALQFSVTNCLHWRRRLWSLLNTSGVFFLSSSRININLLPRHIACAGDRSDISLPLHDTSSAQHARTLLYFAGCSCVCNKLRRPTKVLTVVNIYFDMSRTVLQTEAATWHARSSRASSWLARPSITHVSFLSFRYYTTTPDCIGLLLRQILVAGNG